MYEQFFGLEEEPFRLTPDPRYLFLSSKHAEALAHLKLCLTESSGFVCITGDVGTGKTTLLRLFLSELGPNVSSAYTFVPPLSAAELLRRICREFKLPVSDQTQDELVDQLHQFLMAQHKEGRLCVLILDEAQALSIELLEQIRLLLNLETNTQKLLRIVLVGQPQLRKLLLDPELAQLNQRITLRWHLGPLSSRQTAAYITHRLTVASDGRATRLFTRPALRLIHRISGGVPRLINMVAHRALLAAFVIRQPRVNRRRIAEAYREIQSVPLPGTLSPGRKMAVAAAGLAVGTVLVVIGGPQLNRLEPQFSAAVRHMTPARASGAGAVDQVKVALVEEGPRVEQAASPRVEEASVRAEEAAPRVAVDAVPRAEQVAAPRAADVQQPEQIVVSSTAPPANTPAPMSAAELLRRLAAVDVQTTARAATDGVLTAWGEQPLGADEARLPDQLELIALRRGLLDVGLTGNRSMFRLLDLPAVIALNVPGSNAPRYVALVGMNGAQAVLSVDGAVIAIDTAALDPVWSGQAHVLWRDFDGLGQILARGARGIGITRLQQLLQRAGVFHGRPTGAFDADTETAVLAFQRTHQLAPDGIVGPLTRIVLYRTAGGYPRPTLAPQQEGST